MSRGANKGPTPTERQRGSSPEYMVRSQRESLAESFLIARPSTEEGNRQGAKGTPGVRQR